MMVSCWQFTDQELAELVKNRGRFFVAVIGKNHPPILPGTKSTMVESNPDIAKHLWEV